MTERGRLASSNGAALAVFMKQQQLCRKKIRVCPKKLRLQSILKKRADHLNAESKVSTNDAKIAKGPVIVSAAPESSSVSSRKPETKNQEEKKPVPLPAPVDPPLQGGHYELNARMTRMVETELRDIMIKVWHELPDNPSDEAEALVVDKLRNRAGDDLRNVLGLNITKRLLNVHNPLYVKVQFSGKPEKVHLGEFLRKYNFIAFKRIEKTVNMFAAQVKSINDFDRICSAKDIRCGEIKVNVTPIYKFTKCPPNLVTNFYDQDEDASDETAEKDEKSEDKTENVTTKQNVEDNESEKVIKEDKVVSKPVENNTVVNKAAINKPAIENKTVAENKPVSKPEVETKPIKQTVQNKAPANKPAAVSKPAIENKVNKTPIKVAAEKTAVNTPVAEKPVSKPAVQKNTITKPAVVNKPVVNKPTFANKTAVVKKAAVTNKPTTDNTAAKPAVGNTEVNKPQANPKTNDTGKKTAPTTVKTPVKADKTKKVDDYDELDDHDILALMSEGIVLDECSGSEDE